MRRRSGFSLRRRVSTSSKVLWTLAATCAAISFVLVRGEASQAAAGVDAPQIPVVVAAHDIDTGTSLGADDLTVRPVPVAAELPSGRSAGGAVDQQSIERVGVVGAAQLLADRSVAQEARHPR